MASSRDRAISILELLSTHTRGLPMSEISNRLDIPRAATHRVLADLKDMGYISQDPFNSQYLLTVKLAALGISYLSAHGYNDVVQPVLNDLAAQTGELIRLAVFQENRLIWVSKAQGSQAGLKYDPDAGSEIYLPAAAAGIALLASIEEDEALNLIAEQGIDRAKSMAADAPKSIREVFEHIHFCQENGYSLMSNSYETGISALATAVYSPTHSLPIGVLSIAGPTIRFSQDNIDKYVPLLKQCAANLGAVSNHCTIFNQTSATPIGTDSLQQSST